MKLYFQTTAITLVIPSIECKYKITISNKSLKEYDLILMDKLPFNAQIGMNLPIFKLHKQVFIDIIVLGFNYLRFSLKGTGNDIDYATINHGLGYQLLA